MSGFAPSLSGFAPAPTRPRFTPAAPRIPQRVFKKNKTIASHAARSYSAGPFFKGVLAQLVRAPPCHGGGCGFEPRRLRTFLSDFFRTHHRLSYAQHLEGRKKTCTGASNSRMAALMVAALVTTHLAACDATAKAPSPDVDAPYFNECKQRPGTAPMHAAPQGMRASLRNLRHPDLRAARTAVEEPQ